MIDHNISQDIIMTGFKSVCNGLGFLVFQAHAGIYTVVAGELSYTWSVWACLAHQS